MNKYLIAREQLEKTGFATMTCFGSSMVPILKSGATLRFQKFPEYEVGDLVFCKVRGSFIDAHKITKKDLRLGYMISNNHGHENGWTKQIYGKVIAIL